MSKADLRRVDDNLDAIQEGFQTVLAAHGIRGLRVSHFRLAETKTAKSLAIKASNKKGCWKWVCEMTPTGKICHQVWDPNC